MSHQQDTELTLYQDLLRRLDRTGAPSFEVAEFNYWYNLATRKYVNKQLEVYDLSQKISDSLRILIQDPNFTDTLNVDDTTDQRDTDLPEDYYRLLGVIVTFRYKNDTDCNKKGDTFTVTAKRMTSDLRGFARENEYHRPSISPDTRVYYQVKASKLFIEFDTPEKPETDVVIASVEMEYARQPTVINLKADFSDPVDSEFPPEINDLITRGCMRLLQDNVGDTNKLQSNIATDNN